MAKSKKRPSASRLILPAAIVVALVAAVALAFLALRPRPDGAAGVACLPAPVGRVLARGGQGRVPATIRLVFDASGGMKGYAAAGTQNVIGNLITLTRNFPASSYYADAKAPGAIEFYSFGSYRFDPAAPVPPPRVADPDRFARADAFDQPDTDLADVLRWIGSQVPVKAAAAAAPPLTVLVTDLMLDDRAAPDQFEASVGGGLRNLMIRQGVAVGIMGARVPFSGSIYWNHRTYRAQLADRPLMLILIGDPLHIRTYTDYLRSTGVAPFAAAAPTTQLALFGSEPGEVAAGSVALAGAGGGFHPTPAPLGSAFAQLPIFTFDRGGRDAGGIDVTLPSDAGVTPYEVVGDRPVRQGTIWRLDPAAAAATPCSPADAWALQGSPSPAGWSATGRTVGYKLDAARMDEAALERGTYLMQFVAGQQGLVENPVSAAWMTAWSTTGEELDARLNADPHAPRIGVPGLEGLRRNLIAELMIPGHQAVARSAAQVVVQVR